MTILGRSDTSSKVAFGSGAMTALSQQPGEQSLLKPSNGPDVMGMAAVLHESLIGALDIEKLSDAEPAQARKLIEEAALSMLATGAYPVYGDQRQRLLSLVADEVLGLGPIQGLLDDPSVSEVMVNGYDSVYCERDGIIHLTDVRFRNEEHVRRIADRILAAIGRRVDEGMPMVDARLADGARVNITIPPATPRHSTITVRKFRSDRYRMEDLIAAGTLDNRIAEFLGTCTTYRLNILISGGTGAGKTTFLNALSAYIPRNQRIVTIEDPVELSLQQRHVISMEGRPPDMAGGHVITQRDLLRNALRMRPDRIIIGEVRGAEAFEMLQAMNTGHEGSLSTVHANSPRDALSRIENMVLMAGVDLPVTAIREQMASALHLVLQLQRFADGVRRIVRVTEVTGMEGQTVTMQDIFAYRQEGVGEKGEVIGRFLPTGIRPTFSEILALQGEQLDPLTFFDGARQ